MKIRCVFSLLLLFSSPLLYAENIDLNSSHAQNLVELFDLAKKNNSTYLQAATQYEAAKYQEPIAIANLLPSVNVQGALSYNKSVWPNTTDWLPAQNYNATVTIAVFHLDKILDITQASRALKKAAVVLKKSEETLVNNLISAYFAVLNAEQTLKYNNSNVESLGVQLEQVRVKFRVGLVTRVDVESVQAAYETARAGVADAQANYQNARTQLNRIIGVPVKNMRAIQTNFTAVTLPTLSIIFNNIRDHNVDLLAAEYDISLANLSVTQASVGFYPTLDITGIGTYTNARSALPNTGTVTTKQFSLGGSMTANWNIFASGRDFFAVRAAQAQHKVSMFSYDDLMQSIMTSGSGYYYDVQTAYAQYTAFKQAVVSAQMALEVSRESYNVGRITIVDLLTQQALFLQAQTNLSLAINRYVQSLANLYTVQGQLNAQVLLMIDQRILETSS